MTGGNEGTAMVYEKRYIVAMVSFSEAEELSRNVIGDCLLQYGAT
jgi:hypothetical protein